MRSIVLKDHAIDKDEALALLDEYAEFLEKHTGIECDWYVEGYDFSRVPTEPDSDGDLKPTRDYLYDLEAEVHDRYGDYGVDNIIMWVHEKHFTFKGIWGSNFSYYFHKYSTQLCRWDKDNTYNTFGTLNHELAHSFDRVIKEETGVDVNDEFGFDWDAIAVHGKGQWEYIGRKNGKENTESLELIAPYLKDAYQKRKEKHFAPVRVLQLSIIKLLKSILARYGK